MTPFLKQLREAFVVPDPATVARLDGAISKVAMARTTTDEQILRVKLAFGIDSGDAALLKSFDDRFTVHEFEIGPADRQLRRVLAALILVRRFSRISSERARANAVPDVTASLLVRVLKRGGFASAHPDISAWADYWYGTAGNILRPTTSRSSRPPELPSLHLPEDADPSAALGALVSNVNQHFSSISAWLNASDPSGIRALREQLDVAWWLCSSRQEVSLSEAVVGSARSLAGMTRWVPGPASAQQLLIRRLGPTADTPVSIASARETSGAPPQVRDPSLLPILQGTHSLGDASPSSAHLAFAIYEELLLSRLLGGEQ